MTNLNRLTVLPGVNIESRCVDRSNLFLQSSHLIYGFLLAIEELFSEFFDGTTLIFFIQVLLSFSPTSSFSFFMCDGLPLPLFAIEHCVSLDRGSISTPSLNRRRRRCSMLNEEASRYSTTWNANVRIKPCKARVHFSDWVMNTTESSLQNTQGYTGKKWIKLYLLLIPAEVLTRINEVIDFLQIMTTLLLRIQISSPLTYYNAI